MLSKGMDTAAAADLTQEAFARLWKNCKKVKPESAKAYLFTTINNLFIDEKRKTQTRSKIVLTTKKINKEDGQYELEMKEFKQRLEAAINSMNVGAKEVFVMHRFDEMTYKQIAEALGVGIKAVEKRMHLALKHLAEKNILKRK